jgi:hypothetical protein
MVDILIDGESFIGEISFYDKNINLLILSELIRGKLF